MNRSTFFVTLALLVLVFAGSGVLGYRRITRMEAALARSEEAIARLEGEARRAANFRTIFDALNNPPPGFNQMPVPPPPPGAVPGQRSGAPPGGPTAATMPAAAHTPLPAITPELLAKFLREAKITPQQWDAVQKANLEARSAATLLSRELPDDVDPAVAEAKLDEIEGRRQRAIDNHLAGAQRQAYETFRAGAEIDSVVSLAGGRVRRFFPKY